MSSSNPLVPVKEYGVEPEHLASTPLTPAMPVAWLREHFSRLGKMGVFIEPKSRAIIIGNPEQIAMIESMLSVNGIQSGEAVSGK